jgi:hypothetical protein
MKRIVVKSGDKYGELTVISEVEVSASGKRQVLCDCSCGQQVTARLGHLRSGHTTTCGKCGVEFNGQRKTLRQWAALYGLPESTLRMRLKVMDIGEALKRT